LKTFYSLCEYGMGKVWECGPLVGANLWRTTGDITDFWAALNYTGFSQSDLAPYAAPGRWNDPDMLGGWQRRHDQR
jgi:alpha-galactosidase